MGPGEAPAWGRNGASWALQTSGPRHPGALLAHRPSPHLPQAPPGPAPASAPHSPSHSPRRLLLCFLSPVSLTHLCDGLPPLRPARPQCTHSHTLYRLTRAHTHPHKPTHVHIHPETHTCTHPLTRLTRSHMCTHSRLPRHSHTAVLSHTLIYSHTHTP